MPVKRAVVVGINDYTALDPSGQTNLGACVADAQAFYHLLVNAFGFDPQQIFLYTDRSASRANILRGIRYITSIGQPGDVACFYYSGHGARLQANTGSGDSDKFYETIVPASGSMICDWEIDQIAQRLQPSHVNFTCVLDSCHSGGMHPTDNILKVRSLVFQQALIDLMVRLMKTIVPFGALIPHNLLSNNVGNVRPGTGEAAQVDLDPAPNRTLVQQSKSTLISASSYEELSWEVNSGGNRSHGIFTQSFIDLVNQSNYQISYNNLLTELQTRVAQKVTSQINSATRTVTQTPQLYGQQTRMDEEFLGHWTSSI